MFSGESAAQDAAARAEESGPRDDGYRPAAQPSAGDHFRAELAALREEVEQLRAEVAGLRNVVEDVRTLLD